METKNIALSVIRTDGETQPRTAIDPQVVREYTDALRAGNQFPPVILVHDGANYWLVDGFHRYFAHRRLEHTEILAEISTGELAEARWLSLAANKTHGLHRTNQDKAKAVVRAIKLKPDLGNRAIAEHVGVGETMVRRYRDMEAARSTGGKPSTALKAQLNKRMGRDGKRRPVHVTTRRPTTISKNAIKPIRSCPPPQRMTPLSMPHDPVMGARTLIEVFPADYVRTLVDFLTQHLQGVEI